MPKRFVISNKELFYKKQNIEIISGSIPASPLCHFDVRRNPKALNIANSRISP